MPGSCSPRRTDSGSRSADNGASPRCWHAARSDWSWSASRARGIAAAEERVRIGRELHDIVAHAISVIVVQSQAAQRVLEGEQPSAREALGSIETTGRQALVEMRRLLGVLRTEDDELLLAPRPSLAASRRAG